MSRPRAMRDDLLIEEVAKVNVDYLAYTWTYEEMWATRKHICQMNKGSLVRYRFENALWRAWLALTRQTIHMPAAFISWDKDSDITWLYGPLVSSRIPNPTPSETLSPQAPIKPSLKRKPSVWEIPNLPATSGHCTNGKSPLGQFWNRTIHSMPSVILNPRQSWNKRRNCRVRFEEEVQQCQYAGGGSILPRINYNYNYNYPYFLEESGLSEGRQCQQTIEPLPPIHLMGHETFQPPYSAQYYSKSNFLEELGYAHSRLCSIAFHTAEGFLDFFEYALTARVNSQSI